MRQMLIPKKPARSLDDWIKNFVWNVKKLESPCINCYGTGALKWPLNDCMIMCHICDGKGTVNKDYWVNEYKRMIRDWKAKVKEIKYKNRVLKSIDRKLSSHEKQMLDKLINVCWDGEK